MSAAFRFGVVGAGRMGRNHIKAIADSGVASVNAVADPSAAALQTVSGPGRSVHADLDSMLGAKSIDGVLVCVPTTLHYPTVMRCIEARLPILAEKPFGLNAAQAIELADRAQAAGVPLQVGFWRRFVPTLRDLRSRILNGNLGTIYSICCYQWDGAPPSRYFRERSGGIVADMGVHDFDQIRWLTGQEFEAVEAIASDTMLEEWPGDPESIHILAKLSAGATVSVSLGRRFPTGDICKVEVFGTLDADELRFLWPPTADETFFRALGDQAESFVAHLNGGPMNGASGFDAAAALAAADRATEALGVATSKNANGVIDDLA